MKVLSTDGLTKLIQLIKSAFISVDDTVTTTTVELADVATTGDYDDLINTPAEVTESTVSGWGFTKNAGTVTSVNNVSPVNGNVTLSIPAPQVNSDWNATSGLAQILNKPNLATVATSGSYNDLLNKPTIPDTSNLANKDLSNLSNTGENKFQAPLVSGTNIKTINSTSLLGNGNINVADTTLSNVASIDANSAVQTALDYKVSKSGDTMTDNLTISKDGVTPKLILTNTSFDPTSTTAPEANQYCGALEWQGEDDYLTGFVRNRHSASNNFQTQIGIKRKVNGSDIEAVLNVGINASGEAVCSFPKSYNVDGQWIYSQFTVCNQRAAEKTNKEWDLSEYLPDDDYNYEVLIVGISVTGATSGNINRVYLKSSIITSNTTLAACVTRTSASNSVYSMSTFPIGADKILTVGGYANNTGTYTLILQGYRRLGTND